MVDVQMQPLDLSCPAKRPHSPDLSPSSSLSDIRRLSHGSDDVFVERSGGSGEESEEEQQAQDLSQGEEGPARKRFLSKFFKDPKGEFNFHHHSLGPLLIYDCVPLTCQDRAAWQTSRQKIRFFHKFVFLFFFFFIFNIFKL